MKSINPVRPTLILSLFVAMTLLAISGFPEVGLAAKKVGMLAVEKGVAKLLRRGDRRMVRQPDGLVPLEEGDNIQTGRESRAKVFLDRDNQRVELKAGSVLHLEEVSGKGSFLNFPIGKGIFSVLRKLGREQFQVKTHTALMGVKGTEFVVGTDGISKTYLLTLSGQVSMTSLEFPDVPVLVGPNRASRTTTGSQPTPPVVVPPDVRDSVVSDEGMDTFNQMDTRMEQQSGEQGGEQQNSEEENTEEQQNEESSSGQNEENQSGESNEESGGDGNAGEGSGQESTTDSGSQSGGDTTADTTTSTTTDTPTTAGLIDMVETVQETQTTVETATDNITDTCISSNGCGTVRFAW